MLYTDSLVSESLLQRQSRGRNYQNSGHAFEEMVMVMVDRVQAGKKVVRVHTGDPAFTVQSWSKLRF